MTTFDFEDVFNDAEEEGFGPSDDLTPGKYTATIKSANWGESKNKDPKAGFMFVAAEGSENADGDDVSGDVIWLNATFSEKAKGFAARDCQKLGITGAMLNADPKAAVQTAVGQTWTIEVKLSKDGKWTNCYLGKQVESDDEDERPAKPKASKPKPAPAPEPEEDEVEADVEESDADEGADPWDI